MCDFGKFLTQEDYEVIIKTWLKKKDARLHSYRIRPLSDKAEGFLGDHFILGISNLESGKIFQHQFFLKSKPVKTKTQILLVEAMHSFERETIYFEKYINEFKETLPGFVPNYAPRFLFQKEQKVVVFEDLSVKGYRSAAFERFFDLDLNHMKLVLETVAKMHASSLAYEEIKSKQNGSLFRIFSEDSGIFREEHFRQEDNNEAYTCIKSGVLGLCALLKYFPETKLTREKILDFFGKCCKLMISENKFRRVLAHNDLWQNNIMFKYKNGIPVKAKLVDYQLVAYLRPINDVLFFILLNARDDIKMQYFGYMLRHYHNCVSAELKKYNLNPEEVLPFKEIKESAHCFYPTLKLKSVIYFTIMNASEEYINGLLKDGKSFDDFLQNDRGKYCIELCETEPHYRTTVLGGLAELEDLIINGNQPLMKNI